MQNCTFFQSISIFQRSLFAPQRGALGGSRAALFVRKRTLFAPAVRCMWLSHVGWFMLSPRGRGLQLIVNILIINIFCRGGSRRTTAEG